MAIDTFLIVGRDERSKSATPPLFDLNVSNSRQGQEQNQAQPADHITSEVCLAVTEPCVFSLVAGMSHVGVVHYFLLESLQPSAFSYQLLAQADS
jgi:hypothetical protein